MKVFSVLVSIFCCAAVFANSPKWSIEDVNQGWNSDNLTAMYFHNSELQRQWAWELLGKNLPKSTDRILDFGCGDGKISAEISRLVSQGSVDGYDISSSMVHFSQLKFPSYAYPNLFFHKTESLSFSDLAGSENFDAVYSFCVFHLVEDPLQVLKNLKNHLKPAGKIFLVVPAGKNPAFFQAATETFAKYNLEAPWNKSSAKKSTSLTMRTIEGCSTLLKRAGFEIFQVEMIDTDNPFYNMQELIEWMIGNTTANWNIPQADARAFFTDLAQRMLEIEPDIIDEEGRVHFKLSRIHVAAKK